MGACLESETAVVSLLKEPVAPPLPPPIPTAAEIYAKQMIAWHESAKKLAIRAWERLCEAPMGSFDHVTGKDGQRWLSYRLKLSDETIKGLSLTKHGTFDMLAEAARELKRDHPEIEVVVRPPTTDKPRPCLIIHLFPPPKTTITTTATSIAA
jgi:hypothetical protein